MSAEHEVGRLPAGTGDDMPVVLDAADKTTRAVLTKLDEVIDRINAILVAIETSTDGDSLQSELDTTAIKTELKKLRFTL